MLDHFCQETMALLSTRIRNCLTFCAMPKKSDIFWFLCPKPPWSLGKNGPTYRWNLLRRALLFPVSGFRRWAGWALAHLEFGSSVNPITTRGADYAHHITASPPGFENPAAALACYCLWNLCVKILALMKKDPSYLEQYFVRPNLIFFFEFLKQF